MSVFQQSTQEVAKLIDDLTLKEWEVPETSNIHQLIISMQLQNEYTDNDGSFFIESQEVNESFNDYSSVEMNEELRYKMQGLDLFGSLQKNRDRLFQRNRLGQQQKFQANMAEIQKEYSNKQESCHSLKSNDKRRRKDLRQSKKQIAFKGNSSKVEKIAFLAQDISKLNPGCDLNDNIIQNYLKILKHFFLPSWISAKVHIFSTFFFTKLIGSNDTQEYFEGNSKKQIDKIKQSVRQNYNNIKRWTKNMDISQKQILIFPINAFKHWFCIIVLNLNSIHPEQSPQRKPQIIYCDSMFEKKQIIVQAIKEYLRLQLLDKKRKCINKIVQNIRSFQLLLPRQLNTHDCGLYMLTYIDQLLARPQHLQQLILIENRNKLKLFPRKLIFTMRYRLLRLIDRFTSSHNEQTNNDILLRFFKQKNETCKHLDDFDQIDQQQFIKFKKLNLINPHQINYPPQELQYCQLVRFYLDSDVNYYKKDKIK